MFSYLSTWYNKHGHCMGHLWSESCHLWLMKSKPIITTIIMMTNNGNRFRLLSVSTVSLNLAAHRSLQRSAQTCIFTLSRFQAHDILFRCIQAYHASITRKVKLRELSCLEAPQSSWVTVTSFRYTQTRIVSSRSSAPILQRMALPKQMYHRYSESHYWSRARARNSN